MTLYKRDGWQISKLSGDPNIYITYKNHAIFYSNVLFDNPLPILIPNRYNSIPEDVFEKARFYYKIRKILP